MITFYFRGMPSQLGGYVHGVDSLCSWNCSAAELKMHFGILGKNESISIVAEFDDSTTPWQLVSRSMTYSFKDARSFRDDFPKFYISLKGDIIDSDSFSKEPVMPGPNYQPQGRP